MRIVKAVMTCFACPAQWDAWTDNGSYVYLRYRYGWATATQYSSPDWTQWDADKEPDRWISWCDCGIDHDIRPCYAGIMELDQICRLLNIELDDDGEYTVLQEESYVDRAEEATIVERG